DEPFTRELSGDTMRRLTTFWLAMMGAAALTACAGAHIPPAPLTAAAGVTTRDSSAVQLGTALATVEQDSAADQSALDSLHERTPDSPSAPPTTLAAPRHDPRHA